MINFYDTNALLHSIKPKITDNFLISNLTFKELEEIKTSAKKDQDIKYKARKLINWLMQNKEKYQVIYYNPSQDESLKHHRILSDNTDSRIILSVLEAMDKYPELLFVTYDANLYFIAQDLQIPVSYTLEKNDNYTGFKIIQSPSQEELVEFYSTFNNPQSNYYNLLTNQYLIIQENDENVIDVQKFLGFGKGYHPVRDISFNSRDLGRTKAKDVYQRIAMDSLVNNKITVLRGKAGSGKSYLSLAYLFEKLDKGTIDRIIVFCNTVATQGSAKLGYYPGSRDEKLLDSQIGNFLGSKLGSKDGVQRLMDDGKLILLPMSDIRGFDTTDMHAGIYITQAQNMNIDLMKLALQRVGEDSTLIVEGDTQAQVDLGIYAGTNNGLKRVSQVFRGQDIYGQVTLQNIYRSRIAQVAERM